MTMRYKFKVVICGDHGVGKTSLLRRFVENKFDKDYLSTLGANILSKEYVTPKGNIIELLLWDIAGQQVFKHARNKFYQGAQGAVVVYDVTRPMSFQNIDEWLEELQDSPVNSMILVGNKIDLPKEVLAEDAQKFAEEKGMSFLETSALSNTNVNEAFKTLAMEIVKKHQ
ncbi:MAG: GTP-binding protein [Candidatus Lokiarchaeota archaeon]|nr:GTP-binding protein [Candidatus Lokiarchaeota archaeon]